MLFLFVLFLFKFFFLQFITEVKGLLTQVGYRLGWSGEGEVSGRNVYTFPPVSAGVGRGCAA